jgi:hypothetical protein
VDRRCFTLVAHRLEGAEKHAGLMDGIALAHGGAARRPESAMPADPAAVEEKKRAAQARRRLEALGTVNDPEMAGPGKLMAVLGSEVTRLPDDIAARTIHTVGTRLVNDGKWAEAREVFGLLATRYPGHPLAVEAFRWLVRYHASTEARRRTEIHQKLLLRLVSFDQVNPTGGLIAPGTVRNSGGPVVHEDEYRCTAPSRSCSGTRAASTWSRSSKPSARPTRATRRRGCASWPPAGNWASTPRPSTSSATTSSTPPGRRRWPPASTRGATAWPPSCG